MSIQWTIRCSILPKDADIFFDPEDQLDLYNSLLGLPFFVGSPVKWALESLDDC